MPDLYAFEVPSSTDWAFRQIAPSFHPTVFVDITGGLDRKIDAMQCYESERREAPHHGSEGLPVRVDHTPPRPHVDGELVHRPPRHPRAPHADVGGVQPGQPGAGLVHLPDGFGGTRRPLWSTAAMPVSLSASRKSSSLSNGSTSVRNKWLELDY